MLVNVLIHKALIEKNKTSVQKAFVLHPLVERFWGIKGLPQFSKQDPCLGPKFLKNNFPFSHRSDP